MAHGSRDAVITLHYAAAADARRDRLPDVPRGILTRTRVPVREGEERTVRIELEREKLVLEVRARVRWATPLATGALAGLELVAAAGRDAVQLDLLLGIRPVRGAHPAPAAWSGKIAPEPLRRLAVALLEPQRVLREVLTSALVRFAREGNGWDLQLEAVDTVDAFLQAMARRSRDLAVIDCDGIHSPAEPLLEAVRSRPDGTRLPVVLLSRTRSARLEDRHTVCVQKPVAMKTLLHTIGILVRA